MLVFSRFRLVAIQVLAISRSFIPMGFRFAWEEGFLFR